MGLGLGLAIVRRLAILLHCPVKLCSQFGRGSCFSVEIPRATATLRSETRGALDALTEEARGLIVVVDDEAAIREAMRDLLTSWGYSVLTAGSGAEMTAQIAQSPVRPELIICDYRLRDRENGIDVVRQLRAAIGGLIPAMLVTGDTASGRLVEAQASGLLLLHKPVPKGKLRAAIANLIARSSLSDTTDKPSIK